MPQQRATEPVAQGNRFCEFEGEQRRGVVDLPSRHDHQDHRHCIGPVHGADPGRLNDLCRGGYAALIAGCKAGHVSSLAIPKLEVVNPLYAGTRGFVTAMGLSDRYPPGMSGHKKASRVSPARSRRILVGTRSGRAGYYDAGIRTVSTTWITPLDWLTFGIVTIEVPPLASTIQTLPSWCLTVSSSPSAVLSFLPSVRLEASSLPGTTW